MRTAAGRRALEVVLLVGAVFVLGMLCGERAQAADGVPGEAPSVSPSAATAGTAGTVAPDPANSSRAVRLSGEARQAADRASSAGSRRSGTAGAPASESRTPATGPWGADTGTVQLPRPTDPVGLLAETPVRSVGERVARPVGELVGAVTGRSAALPEEPPVLPVLPVLPGLTQPAPPPDLPGLPAVPGHALPAPVTPDPGPGAPAPRPEAPTAPTSPSVDASSAPRGRAGAAVPVVFGPEATDAGGTTRGGEARDVPQGAAHTEPAPASPAPAGQPDGAVGNRSTADNGAPRHGDAHAVTPCPRPSLRLAPGATERAEATGTRGRYRDVPVSPA
ncbi:hypothetical protein SUDANB176_04564 [Streptomyces sp. enrichment culture]